MCSICYRFNRGTAGLESGTSLLYFVVVIMCTIYYRFQINGRKRKKKKKRAIAPFFSQCK